MRVTPQEILNGPIQPILTRMTIPMVISIFFMMAFQAVDTFFVSKLGTEALAAISFTFPVTFVLVSMTIGMSIAMSVIVGRAIGAGNRDQAARLTTDALMFSLMLVMVVSAIGLATVDPLFTRMGATPVTLQLIHEYLDIWYIYFAFMVIPMVGNSALRATGDTKWPSIMMIVSGLLNVILDPIFIFGWGPVPAMGVSGAAYATVISWMVGFVFGIWLLGVREKLISTRRPNAILLLKSWAGLVKLGMPISLANMLTPITIAVLTTMIASYGEEAVAAFGAGARIESFVMVIALALTASLSPYMAQNIGADQPERAERALMMSIKFVFILQVVLGVLLVVFAGSFGQIFSEDPEVLMVINQYLWIMPIGICFYGVVIILHTAFNANRQSNKTLLVSFVRLAVFVAPLAWLGGQLDGVQGLFAGAVSGNILAAGFAWWLYTKHVRLGEYKNGAGVADKLPIDRGPEQRAGSS